MIDAEELIFGKRVENKNNHSVAGISNRSEILSGGHEPKMNQMHCKQKHNLLEYQVQWFSFRNFRLLLFCLRLTNPFCFAIVVHEIHLPLNL